MRWILGGFLAVLLGFGGYVAIYLGAFKSVKVSDGTADAMTLLGKEHIGSYHKIVPVIEEVETWAKENGIDCTRSFGLYLDDTNHVEEPRLKSFGGCIVDGSTIPPLPEGFEIRAFSAPHFVKVLFEGSPGIGPFKVYPKAEKYAAAKGFVRLPSVLEVYIIHSQKEMTTTYYFPVQVPDTLAPIATPPTTPPKEEGT